ncbi:hypothetical protein IWX64_000001, partial [Arthrobacter sp. CAN_A212]
SAVLTGNRFPNLALKESVGKVAVSHPMLTDRGGVGSAVSDGLAGAVEGDTAGEVGEADGVLGAGVLGAGGVAVVTDSLTVVVGAAWLLVGAAAGGPKHPVSTITPESPRILTAEDLLMALPLVRPRPVARPHFQATPAGS